MVLLELKSYCQEVDTQFVRKAIKSIGQCAIKVDEGADRCVKVLLALIETKKNYILQSVMVVIKDIFRRYPGRYEKIIAKLCENLTRIDEAEARASLIWIIGEYADRIGNAASLIEYFMSTYEESPTEVKLQLLTATVKLFLKRPKDGPRMVNATLKRITDSASDPDLRDRAVMYWRLLCTNPNIAAKVVLGNHDKIGLDSLTYSEERLDMLLQNVSTMSAIYHKDPTTFVEKRKTFVEEEDSDEDESDEDEDEEEEDEEEEEEEEEEEDEDENEVTSSGGVTRQQSDGLSSLFSAPPAPNVVLDTLVSSGEFQMKGKLVKSPGGGVAIKAQFSTVGKFQLQIKNNCFGLSYKPVTIIVQSTEPMNVPLDIAFAAANIVYNAKGLQCAMKKVGGKVAYFYIPVDISVVLNPADGTVTNTNFTTQWMAEPSEATKDLPSPTVREPEQVKSALVSQGMKYHTSRNMDSKVVYFLSAKFVSGPEAVFSLSVAPSGAAKIKIRISPLSLAGPIYLCVKNALCS